MKNKIDLLNDLYNVGKTKSLGYLPINTIVNICDTQIETILKYAKSNNLKTILLSEKECTIRSGALFVYNEKMLREILNKNKDILKEANIPTKERNYILYIAKNHVSPIIYEKAYEIIGITFNDKRFLIKK